MEKCDEGIPDLTPLHASQLQHTGVARGLRYLMFFSRTPHRLELNALSLTQRNRGIVTRGQALLRLE